jgi:predicted GNAT superfamily acetyltransferase
MPDKPDIQPLMAVPAGAMLALNGAHERETSALTPGAYSRMLATAFYARGVAPDLAFLIAFDETAPYGSPNFLWFRERERTFVYIDRIIVNAAARGQGLARALYEDLFRVAQAAGKPLVCCEVNSDPPNPGSDAFHAKMGFTEAGSAALENGKTVRYLTKPLTP